MTPPEATFSRSLRLNPQDQQVEIYRQGQSVEILKAHYLLGEDILLGFILDLSRIFVWMRPHCVHANDHDLLDQD
jgi:hypothetical protein